MTFTVAKNFANEDQGRKANPFFDQSLQYADPSVYTAIAHETKRQQNQIEMIASENIVSRAVLEAQGSIFTNKYAEGYPGKRYYQGCQYMDVVEDLARDRAKKLFGCAYANVQPHSGASANQAVFMALLQPGDTILGMDLSAGGHLTHGSSVNQSGKWFNAVTYGVRRDNGLIDYDSVAQLAREHKPKMIICGASAYPRVIDFERFRTIADQVGAVLMADVAHYAGLIVGGAYPSPFPFAHVVTTTTHKTLRGPRGGLILTNDDDIAKKINSAVFPGLQGGPLMHVIAAKAVAFTEAARPEFKKYAKSVIDNARVLGDVLSRGGLALVTGGTDSHMVVVDLRPKGLTGVVVDAALERAGITCNKNAVPFDPEKPTVTSGIRLGTPAGTTRGFGEAEFRQVGEMILSVIDGLAQNGADGNGDVEETIKGRVADLCGKFPIY
jgi:glycine hydroxymethyltransferase